jgi:PPOX class probable F420-dependent enzyme
MTDLVHEVPGSRHDLLEAPLTATLTTIDVHGRPQSTAVWSPVDEDGQLKSSITTDRQKYTNLTGNPNCDFFIIDPANPFRTLEVRAEASLEPDPDKELVRTFARAHGADESVLVHPEEDRHTVVYRARRVVANPPAPAG